MEKYLIVNADDFGLSKEVNGGIIDSFRNGCVTSASLIVTETAFDDAVEKIKENPSLDIGIHLNITRGRVKQNLVLLFLNRLLRGKAVREKIYREFESQIQKCNIRFIEKYKKYLHNTEDKRTIGSIVVLTIPSVVTDENLLTRCSQVTLNNSCDRDSIDYLWLNDIADNVFS